MTFTELETTVNTLAEEVASYNLKPTKAGSKRIRLLIGDIKSNAPKYREVMRELDKSSK